MYLKDSSQCSLILRSRHRAFPLEADTISFYTDPHSRVYPQVRSEAMGRSNPADEQGQHEAEQRTLHTLDMRIHLADTSVDCTSFQRAGEAGRRSEGYRRFLRFIGCQTGQIAQEIGIRIGDKSHARGNDTGRSKAIANIGSIAKEATLADFTYEQAEDWSRCISGQERGIVKIDRASISAFSSGYDGSRQAQDRLGGPRRR